PGSKSDCADDGEPRDAKMLMRYRCCLRLNVTVTPTGSALGAPIARFLRASRTQAPASGVTFLADTISTPSARPRDRTRNWTLMWPVDPPRPPCSPMHLAMSERAPLSGFSMFGTSPLSNVGVPTSTVGGAAGATPASPGVGAAPASDSPGCRHR